MDIIWAISRYILPVITVVIIFKCVLTLMLGHPKEKTYGYIIDMKSGNRYPLNMWETSVGRSKSCDVVLPYDTVARSHAVITRRIDGWYIHDLLTKAELKVNGETVELKTIIKDGDIIHFGKNRFRFEIIDDPVQAVGKRKNRNKNTAEQKPATRTTPASRPASEAQSKPTAPKPGGYANDAQLRKRTTRPEQKITYSNSYHYDESNKPQLHFEKSRPVTSPSYNRHGDVYTVETASRQQPARRTKKQPRIINKDTGETFILCGNEVTIGSGRKCDIRLRDTSAEKLHSLLVLYEDGWAIDKARGKAYLNGIEVRSPQLLFDGDIIALGEERLYYHN